VYLRSFAEKKVFPGSLLMAVFTRLIDVPDSQLTGVRLVFSFDFNPL